MKKSLILARKYAQAFLNAHADEITYDDILQFERAQDYIKPHKAALLLLTLPSFTPAMKRAAVFKILGKFYIPQGFTYLVDLLIEHKRILLLYECITALISLYREQHAIMIFSITSSHELAQTSLDRIQQFLTHATKCVIMYKYAVNTQLIAGIRLQSATFLWEQSIQKDLKNLSICLVR
jgi:ATP synthase F1 delta subunit